MEPREIEYETGFRDKQRLRIIHDKLLVASNVLESKLQIALAVHDQCNHPRISENAEVGEPLGAVQQIMERIRGFKRTTTILLMQTEGISDLVSLSMYT